MRHCWPAPRGAAARLIGLLGAAVALLAAGSAASAATIESVLEAVVKVSAEVPPDARTARNLGTHREGSGVVIDGDGLVVTIGYLILEASGASIGLGDGREVPARIVAYDHDTGFGLLRATRPLGVAPLALGDSAALAARTPALVASYGGPEAAMGAYVVSRRAFAGSWEYLIEDAIFTAPAHPVFGGAALIDREGRLVGIGSLIVPDAAKPGSPFPGNMFVPIDALKPILGDLLALGRSSKPPRPWLGLSPQEALGRVIVARVSPGGPAAEAGIRPGDIVLSVGGQEVDGMADYYRKLWALGAAGTVIPLEVLRDVTQHEFRVRSIDRMSWLHTRTSY